MKIAHRKHVWFKDGEWYDTLTNVFSGGGGFSHSELLFDDGAAFTSTTDVGVGFIRRGSYDPRFWAFTELNITPEQEITIRRWCNQAIADSIRDKAGYDWRGVLRFVLPLKQSAKDWFCSEAVVSALQSIGMFANVSAWRVSPNLLWKMCRSKSA